MRISDWSSDVCSSDLTDVRFHPEIVLISFLCLVHFGVAFTVLVLGRTGRMNDRRIDHSSLTQQQNSVAQIAVDDLQNPTGQLMFFQQPAEVEDRGIIRNTIQMQPGRTAEQTVAHQSLMRNTYD